MTNISLRYPDYCGGAVAIRRYLHRGVVIEQSGLDWVIWQDFVTPHHSQLRASTLKYAKMAIDNRRGGGGK